MMSDDLGRTKDWNRENKNYCTALECVSCMELNGMELVDMQCGMLHLSS